MVTDEVVHLSRVAVVSAQQALTEHIHRMLFVALCVVIECFFQSDITKGLRKCQQKGVFAGFTTGQNFIHNIPLAAGRSAATAAEALLLFLFTFFGG